MESWPSRRLRLYAAKAQLGQIKLIDKDIDRSNWIVLAQIVIQPLWKQSALTAVIANDKARHRILPPNRRRIISLKVFSHSLGQNAKYSPRVDVFRFASKLRRSSMRSALRICAMNGPCHTIRSPRRRGQATSLARRGRASWRS